MWGDRDRFLEPHLADAALARCRSARVLRRDAGHWVHVEDAEAVDAALIAFLAES